MAEAAVEIVDIEPEDPVEEMVNDEAPLEYDDDELNLVPTFKLTKEGRLELKRICDEVVTNFDKCWEATEEYRDRMSRDWRLFAGELPPKNFPFKDCANLHIPIMIETISRLAFRTYGEIFSNWNNVFGVAPIGPGDEKIADILTTHGNWQIRNQITDFKRQMHRAVLAFYAIGDFTCHSYYDEQRGTNRHEILLPNQFVVPYRNMTTQ